MLEVDNVVSHHGMCTG